MVCSNGTFRLRVVSCRYFGSSWAKPRARQQSPLLDFQLNEREVQQMAPHVLSAAVSRVGGEKLGSEGLWRAYSERVIALGSKLSLRDARLVLQGCADARIRDRALLQSLGDGLPRTRNAATAPQDVVSIAVALAKLGFSDARAFTWMGDRVIEDLDDLSPAELGGLVNAFSRASRYNAELFHGIAVRIRRVLEADASELTPAAVALVLNGSAVCSHCDQGLWLAVLESVVAPRIGEFTITQGALVVTSIVKCANAISHPEAWLRLFADHWISQGLLERAAAPSDLAYIANSFARLRVTSIAALNLGLATSALRQLSSFKGGQLAMFCSALATLPSSGRDAFLVIVAQHSVPEVLVECKFGDMGAIIGALVSARTPISPTAGDMLYARVLELSQETASSFISGAGRGRSLGHMPVNANALTSIYAGLALLAAPKGPQVLSGLRPLAVLFAGRHELGPRAVLAVLAAHAHFRVRDPELCAVVAVCLSEQGSFAWRRLLGPLASLGSVPAALQGQINDELRKVAQDMSLGETAQNLLSASSLSSSCLSADTTSQLWARAEVLCKVSTPKPRIAAQLVAAYYSQERSHAFEDTSFHEVLSAVAPSRLEPPPHAGLLREVLRACFRAFDGCEATSGQCVRGFHLDLLVRWDSAAVAFEVNGPERFYHGTRALISVCDLKHKLHQDEFDRIVQTNFWEWPSHEDEQVRFLRQRVSL